MDKDASMKRNDIKRTSVRLGNVDKASKRQKYYKLGDNGRRRLIWSRHWCTDIYRERTH